MRLLLRATLLLILGLPFTAFAAHAPLDRSCLQRYAPEIREATRMFNLPYRLLPAVILAESNCQHSAHSAVGAVGLLQLIPASGARDAYRQLYRQDGIPTARALRSPKVNILLGGQYLAMLRHHYQGVPEGLPRLVVTLAAYNWGQGNVDRALADQFHGRYPIRGWYRWLRVRAPVQTERYVRKIINRMCGPDPPEYQLHLLATR